jgi:hypothetical protein
MEDHLSSQQTNNHPQQGLNRNTQCQGVVHCKHNQRQHQPSRTIGLEHQEISIKMVLQTGNAQQTNTRNNQTHRQYRKDMESELVHTKRQLINSIQAFQQWGEHQDHPISTGHTTGRK